MLAAAGLSDIGCKRLTNEDRILVDFDGNLFAVADGMGGAKCGGRAAELATAALREYFHLAPGAVEPGTEPSDVLSSLQNRMAAAIQLANERVFEESSNTPECEGMGCTLSAITFFENVAVIGHVGDSRIYLFRNNELIQLTRDDSVVAQLISAGEIAMDEGSSHPMRHMLTQSIGSRETISIQLRDLKLQPGDRLLMTSDGVHGVISEQAIFEILAMREPSSDIAYALILATRNQEAPDNASTIVIDYDKA
jgi:protein phosphatase